MRARKCDRCGAFYEKNMVNTRDKRGVLTEVAILAVDGHRDINMDLCDKCMTELIDFLKQGQTQKDPTWAEKEVERACKHNNDSYDNLCYKSALKAYNSLMEEGHSSHSIGYTMHTLKRLTRYLPLTPIEDTDDAWCDNAIDRSDDGYISYQSKRKPSLFKNVYMDGTIKYYDNDYCYCVNINNKSAGFSNRFISDIIHEMFPIKMPYYPVKTMKVVIEDFLYDEKNGDYDTMGVLYLIDSDGQRVDINKYFAEDANGNLVEISKSTYTYRKNRQVKKG